MRLDKYLVSTGYVSRSEAGKLIRSGKVSVNGTVIQKPESSVDECSACVLLNGQQLEYRKFTYILLNKPQGYISATEDGREPTVLELLPEHLRRIRLFPCGRLDKNTVGLMLLTNNGNLAHRLLSPKYHVDKSYRFTVADSLTTEDVARLEAGVNIGGYVTAPCKVCMDGETDGMITIHEGKYHQIKLMMQAVGTKILQLERVTFGMLTLDESLPRGSWRYLSEAEIRALENASSGKE